MKKFTREELGFLKKIFWEYRKTHKLTEEGRKLQVKLEEMELEA